MSTPQRPTKSLEEMPGPEPSELEKIFIHGNDIDFRHFQSYQPYVDYQKRFGDLVNYKISAIGEQVLVSNPKDVTPIYESPDYNARPADRVAYIGYLSGLIAGKKHGEFGYGVVNDNTARWAQKRHIHDVEVVKTYPSYIPFMNEHARELVEKIKSFSGGHKSFEIREWSFLRRWTFEMIGEAYLGKEDFNHDHGLKERLFEAQEYWLDHFHWYAPIQGPAKGTWNIPAALASLYFDHKLAPVQEFFAEVYKRKKARNFAGNDWMSIMGRTAAPDGTHLTEEELKICTWDMITGCVGPLPFVIEFGMYQLGKNGWVQEKVAFEDKQHLKGKPPGDLSLVDLHELKFLYGTMQELLRMYPASGAVNMRTSTKDVDNFEGYHIPKATTMVINTQHINRDPSIWTEPNNVDPKRWSDDAPPLDRETAKKPYGNLAFGGGARFCPGRDFSLMLCNVLWAHIIRNFSIEYNGKDIEPTVYMELISRIPKDELTIKFTSK